MSAPLVAAFIVLSAGLAGCVSSEGGERVGHNAFTATYAMADGSALVLTLAPGDPVLARDGTMQSSYRLLVSQDWGGEEWQWVYHLDADLRVIRYDALCGEYADGDCVRHRLYWYTSGQPAGFGVGLPAVYPDPGRHGVTVGHLGGHHDVKIERGDGSRTWSVDLEDEAFVGPGTLLPGAYTFSDGELAPTGLRMDRKGAITEGTRVALEEHGPLPPIERPALRRAASAKDNHLLFPGDDVRLLNSSDTPRGFIQRAQDAVDDFATAVDQGCIAGFGIAEGTDVPPGLSRPALPGDTEVVDRFDVTTVGPAGATDWEFEVRRDEWSGDEEVVLRSESDRPFRFDCSTLAKMPPPCIEAGRWLDLIRSVAPVDHENERISIEYKDDPRAGNGSLSTLRYAYFAQPSWMEAEGGFVAYESLQVKHDGATGWFYHVNLEASTFDAFLSANRWPLCG